MPDHRPPELRPPELRPPELRPPELRPPEGRPPRLRPTLQHTRSKWYRRPAGPWDVPTLDEALARGRGSLVDGSARMSSAAVSEAVARLAGGLRRWGVRRGEAVTWQLPNGWPAHLLFRACWRLGAVAVPVHPGAGPADSTAALDQIPIRLLVGGAGEVERLIVEGAGAPVPLAASPGRPSDLAVVLFTSGSTGRPKAVLHTQRGLLCKARTMTALHGLNRHDTVLMPAPLAHISGLLNGILVPGVTGMRTVWMSRWEPSAAVGLIEAEQVSFMIGPPTFFVSLMAAPGYARVRVRSLRLISSGGAGVTPAFVSEAAASIGARVKRTYGSTEAPTVTTTGPHERADRARDTDGRATGEAEVRVCDPATGTDRPAGETGEVWLRGPELFVGYADASATRQVVARGGWFKTGDLGVLDDGWLSIVGRMKDVIIRGGENIAAAEVESHLEAHPAVRQAAAVGYPDRLFGERVCAFIVASGSFDLTECRRWMEARGVTRFKWPERIERLDEMPLLSAGKIDRAALREISERRTRAGCGPSVQG